MDLARVRWQASALQVSMPCRASPTAGFRFHQVSRCRGWVRHETNHVAVQRQPHKKQPQDEGPGGALFHISPSCVEGATETQMEEFKASMSMIFPGDSFCRSSMSLHSRCCGKGSPLGCACQVRHISVGGGCNPLRAGIAIGSPTDESERPGLVLGCPIHTCECDFKDTLFTVCFLFHVQLTKARHVWVLKATDMGFHLFETLPFI